MAAITRVMSHVLGSMNRRGRKRQASPAMDEPRFSITKRSTTPMTSEPRRIPAI